MFMLSYPALHSLPRRIVAFLLLACGAGAASAGDAAGCKDHPLFNRLPAYAIYNCKQVEFDAVDFPNAGLKEWSKPEDFTTIEGKVHFVSYTLKEGATVASSLQVMRNFQSAAKAVAGTVLADFPDTSSLLHNDSANSAKKYLGESPSGLSYDRYTTLKLPKGKSEFWVMVAAHEETKDYVVLVVEREAMKQVVAVNDWLDQINKDGWVEIEINFDTGKATIKPESAGNVAQMVQLLKTNAALKVEVGGHTDNVGDAASNLKLSEARAKSVMDALVKGGIAAARLTAKGYGQTVPVADNRREAGRAKNRRVELVKK